MNKFSVKIKTCTDFCETRYIENLTLLSCWMNKFSVKIKHAQIFIVKHTLHENEHQYQSLIVSQMSGINRRYAKVLHTAKSYCMLNDGYV